MSARRRPLAATRAGSAALLALALAAAACGPAPDPFAGPGPCSFWEGLDGKLSDWMVAWRRLSPGLTCRGFDDVSSRPLRLSEPTELSPADVQRHEMAARERHRSVDGRRLVLVGGEGGPRVLDVAGGTVATLLDAAPGEHASDAAWLPDGRLVVAGHRPAPGEDCGAPECARPSLDVIDWAAGTVTTHVGPAVAASAVATAAPGGSNPSSR